MVTGCFGPPVLETWWWVLLQLRTVKVHLFYSERMARENLLILQDHVDIVKRSWFSIFWYFSWIVLGDGQIFEQKKSKFYMNYNLMSTYVTWPVPLLLPKPSWPSLRHFNDPSVSSQPMLQHSLLTHGNLQKNWWTYIRHRVQLRSSVQESNWI